jgi:hypothetical protein
MLATLDIDKGYRLEMAMS